MPDYIYLLENRLSADQRHALTALRKVARDAGTILFLTGDAVRDLTSGHAVRELEVAVHGNALKLKKPLEKLGAKVWGEDEPSRSLYLCFPGTVRVNVVSAHRVEYPKPGKPMYHWTSIQDDLRRRDFTINSMAISLNEGSFGLLMDPLNGAADIESRTLRLVSNYGFLQQPSLLIRAVRYRARLGWELDSRTQTRYEDARNEGVIEFLSAHERSQELEQIGHEEEALKVLRALEAEGWMKVLFPAWTAAKADEAKLNALHELAVQFLQQGVHPDLSAAQMQLLTAKLQPKDLSALKRAMLRPGFVEEWNHLDSLAHGFAKVLLSKQSASPSAGYKLFMSYDPEAILWLGFISKDKAVQERFHLFLKVWPEARQRIPYVLMQEMRITPELPIYAELVEKIFLELIDGRLSTPEEMRAYLEPYSPPPPLQVTVKRTRGRRAEARIKEQELEDEEESEDGLAADDDLEPIGDEEELDLSVLPKSALEAGAGDENESDEDEEETAETKTAPAGKKKSHAPAPAKKESGKAEVPAPPAKPAPQQPASKGKPALPPPASKDKPAAPSAKPAAAPVKPAPPQPAAKGKPAAVPPQPAPQVKPAPGPVKPAPQKPHPAPAVKAKPVPARAVEPAKPAAKKPAPAKAKAPAKATQKKPAKPAPKPKSAAKKAEKKAAKKGEKAAKKSKHGKKH
jgi:tRNA nucleotidyltransferase/poly(A) polymerase